MRLAAAVLVLLLPLLGGVNFGTPGHPPGGRFAFGVLPDTQNRIDGIRFSVNFLPGPCHTPQQTNRSWGDELAAIDTDTGFLLHGRSVAAAWLTYPERIRFVAHVGDVAESGGDIWGAAQGKCAAGSGHCWEGYCQKAIDSAYTRSAEGLEPLIRAGICVLGAAGNHDTNCVNNKRYGIGTSAGNRCSEDDTTGDDQEGYRHWLSRPAHRYAKRSCPEYQDDSEEDGYGVTGANGSGLGLNQTTLLPIGGRQIRVISLNVEASDSEMDWVRGILDGDPLGLPTIVVTHIGPLSNGEMTDTTVMFSYGSLDMDTIVDEIQLTYPNVFLLVGGHHHGAEAQTGGGFEYDLVGVRRNHTGVGDEEYGLTLMTCNFQDLIGGGDLPLCVVTVDPAANTICWEAVVPAWESDEKAVGPWYEGPLMSDSVGPGKRLDVMTAQETRGCVDLDWTG